MIQTNLGNFTEGGLLDELLYINYAHNRDSAPHLTVEQFAKLYPMADQLEARYQAERAIVKAAA